MPASSLYWIQKSASSVSSAAGKRSKAASPGVRLPAADAVLASNPPAAAPAPTANPFSKKFRRLNETVGWFAFSPRFEGLLLMAPIVRFFNVVIILSFFLSSMVPEDDLSSSPKVRGSSSRNVPCERRDKFLLYTTSAARLG